MLNIFTDNWNEPPVLYEGERLCHILTGNPCDALFVVRPSELGGEENDDAFIAEIQWALMRKFGKRGPRMYAGFEDVTDLYYATKEEPWATGA